MGLRTAWGEAMTQTADRAPMRMESFMIISSSGMVEVDQSPWSRVEQVEEFKQTLRAQEVFIERGGGD